jgi:hypothetical protein
MCLDEIDSCRPYFIGFLGNRYGWSQQRGREDMLLKQTFGNAMEKHPWLKDVTDRSVTELEVLHSTLNKPLNPIQK